MDAVLVPPGQEYVLTNTGDAQMTAVVILTPKPTRADEVRVPGDTRPFRKVRPDRDEERPPRPRSEERGGRQEGRRESPYGGARPAGPPRGAPRTAAARDHDRSESTQGRPRRGGTGARAPRRDEGEGPVWFPKAKPAWRPRGAPPAGAGSGRPGGRSTAPQPGGSGRGRRPGGSDTVAEAFQPRRPSRPPADGGSGKPRGQRYRGTGGGRSSAGRSAEKKTGDARRASRGQGPLSGRRGPGRSVPRTSAPRRSPE
jgi:hypothetical protein